MNLVEEVRIIKRDINSVSVMVAIAPFMRSLHEKFSFHSPMDEGTAMAIGAHLYQRLCGINSHDIVEDVSTTVFEVQKFVLRYVGRTYDDTYFDEITEGFTETFIDK